MQPLEPPEDPRKKRRRVPMNRHFSSDPREYPEEFPARAFARVDSVEENAKGELIVGLDAVSERSVQEVLAARSPDDWRAGWRDAFRGEREPDGPGMLDYFAMIELYHVEVTTDSTLAASLFADAGDRWIGFSMNRQSRGGFPANVYSGLFAPAQPARVLELSVPPGSVSSILSAAFSMHGWPIASDADVERQLRQGTASMWAAYDIGQGSANGLLDDDGAVRLFHDMGCGVYANAKTRPTQLVLCSSGQAPIVLSHWDTDHWAGARYFAPPTYPSAFLSREWIVPFDSSIGPRHIAFAASILAAGGHLHVTKPGPWQSPWVRMRDGRRVRLLRGSGSDRNGAGMAMEIHDPDDSGGRWLLTGDVDYPHLQPHLAERYTAIAVPHHGAASTAAPSPQAQYARLVYSFGHNNSYGHPKSACITEHLASGWDHGKWTPTLDATDVAKADVLATNCNAPGQSHLGSVLIGWHQAPPCPSAAGCGGTQCSAHLAQS